MMPALGSHCTAQGRHANLGVGAMLALEPLTPPIHEACADDRGCQLQKRFVDVKAPFKADSQFAKASKPSVRPLHYPAMFAQPFAAFNAAPGNAAGYASLPQMGKRLVIPS